MNTSANTYFSIPAALKSFPTTSVGCAPLLSHFLAASSLIEKPLGSRLDVYKRQEDVLVMDIEGNIIEGERKPSVDTVALLYILKHMPERCV